MSTRRMIAAPVLIGLLAWAGFAPVRGSQDAETTSMVPELEVLHEVIMPMWHQAYPSKDVAALRSFVPEIEKRAAGVYAAALPGILRDKKAKWDQGIAALKTSVEAYKAAALGQDDQRLLDATETLHSKFEALLLLIHPVVPAVEAFHKVLYVVYHKHLPNRAYTRIGLAAEEMVTKADAVRTAQLPPPLSAKTAAYEQAAEALHAAAVELAAATRGGNGPAIERAVETLHTKYLAVQKIFE